MRTVALLVPAAGSGDRMGGAHKPFLELGDRRVLDWALGPFLERRDVVEVIVAVSSARIHQPLGCVDGRIRTVEGGDSRFDSVARALDAVRSVPELVAVHDGARPFPPPEVIDHCIRDAGNGRGTVAAIRAIDTVKRVSRAGLILETPDRRCLWYAQTPQVFPHDLFRRAVDGARAAGWAPTDDASMVERVGGRVKVVESSGTNLKVTSPHDLRVALMLGRRAAATRLAP